MDPSTNHCIPFSLFVRSFKVPARTDKGRAWRVQRSAWKAIQKKAENHIAAMFRRAADIAQQDGRVTVQVTDVEDALRPGN